MQFSYVSAGPDGRTYVTWSEIEDNPQGATFTHRMRVAERGAISFGPTRTIAEERAAIPFGGKLNASEFRVVTILKSAVVSVRGRPRVVAVWEACAAHALGYVCEDARVKVTWSDDRGKSWHHPRVISVEGQNYFPAIAAGDGGRVAVAYYTSRHDPAFDNRQDVELVTLDRDMSVTHRQRITPVSNESEADPVLGGLFLGDYISVAIKDGRAFVHYTGNYRRERLLQEGRPIPQQDTFLTVRRL